MKFDISFPSVSQQDSMDCGPACIHMIALYYKKYINIEKLRIISGTTSSGTSLRGLVCTLETVGFDSSVVEIGINDINSINLPCILHVKSNHYVILYEIKNRRGHMIFYIADPSLGKQKYSLSDMKTEWCVRQNESESCGIVISMQPNNNFSAVIADCRHNSVIKILAYLRPHRKLIGQLILGLIFGSLLQLAIPFLTQALVDYGITTKNIQYIYYILIAQVAISIGSVSFDFIRGWILLHMGTKINVSLIYDFFHKLTKLSISFFDNRKVGDILQRLMDHSKVEYFLTNSTLSILFSLFSIIVFSIVIIIYSWQIFLIYAIGTLLYIVWVKKFMKKRERIDNENFHIQSTNQSALIELIMGMHDIKLNTCEDHKISNWVKIQSKLYELKIRGLGLSQTQDTGGVIINQFKNLIITAIVATFVVENKLTLGMMISIQYIIGQLNSPTDQIISFFRHIQDAKLSLRRLHEIQQYPEEVEQGRSYVDIPFNGNISLHDMSFSYNKHAANNTLSNIELNIPNGKCTAIVGMSGSGKTTLLKILLGFYLPKSGIIKIGDISITDVNIRAWRKKCGVVMQDGYIYSDTVANNIAPQDATVDMERIVYSAKLANIHVFIDELALGYNTVIGRDGQSISQGQKQRLLIARAIYKNPEYIFLDEATNSLDASNERVIMDNMSKFLMGKTSIIVALRLSTVKYADQIVVLDKGAVIEIGTHEQLINQNGVYYQLVKNQLNI